MEFSKIPKIDRKTKQQNGFRWVFYRYNHATKKNEKIHKSSIPPYIWSSKLESEVEEYCRSQSALEDTIKDRIKKRLEWEKKYHNFEKLLHDFELYHMQKAPNAWKNDIHYLRNYVFSFFLGTKQSNNVNQWNILYEDFRLWLGSVKPLKKNIKSLSLNTQNKAINALNRFVNFLIVKGKCEFIQPMAMHERAKLPEVTIEDLLSENEVELVYEKLNTIRPTSAKIFLVLVRTGLRINEALGLCLKYVIQGQIKGGLNSDKLHSALMKYSLGEYYGYLILESQPMCETIRVKDVFVDRDQRVWAANTVPRKPLKCRKKIEPKAHRIIPVYDKKTWNIIVESWNTQREAYLKKQFGSDIESYLLFEGVTASMFYTDLMKAFGSLKLKKRSPHKMRHTFLTWFYGQTLEDAFIAEKVGGHRDKKSLEVYSHMREQLGRELQVQQQHVGKMNIID